ncbi:MAG: [FeFe] hydrogenase H-cluster maturation GTPase HydF [Endomicrobium sp.]|jgi:[FeFe] hydrogenase H-cluster maturation GTPase HydF|nr:[FeFe] hydrogenase H-cluster maturation GTPase HydF [Endomicrobium sp.]
MKALTVQIGIFGRTNVGKSSLMNFILNQNISIVSELSGTTTDVVSKQMELTNFGPITLFDTAGINDRSVLGYARKEKTRKVFNFVDVILLLCEVEKFYEYEKYIIKNAKKNETPFIIVISKSDLQKPKHVFLKKIKKYTKNVMLFSVFKTNRDVFLNSLKKILNKILPDSYTTKYSVLKNILKQNDPIILITPIDLGAPSKKIIMPQIQILRDSLDLHAVSYVIQDTEYEFVLRNSIMPPKIVITDSQFVKQIASKTPKYVKLTTFSIIFSAEKSNIVEMAKGAAILNKLENGDKILIYEACTHHASIDDIGKVKLPILIKSYTKKEIIIDHKSGCDYPKNISNYKLIIHCGGCTLNRKNMLIKLADCMENKVSITNYGIAISVFCDVIEKVLEIFPLALKSYIKSLNSE